MKSKVLTLLGTLVLAGCMEPTSATSVEDSIAAVFPDPRDQTGIAVVVDFDGPEIVVVHYTGEVSDAEVLARVQRYCMTSGFQSANPVRVRDGADLIQPDDSIKESRRGDYTCT